MYFKKNSKHIELLRTGIKWVMPICFFTLSTGVVEMRANPSSGATPIVAQANKSISGRVVDQNGDAVIGANVTVKGTMLGTITDVDGNFQLSDVPENGQLDVSYIGYSAMTVSLIGKSVFDIKLAENTQALDEVVVTALGISREKKALGYAVQDLSGELLDGHAGNFASTLSGKIAGVSVNSNSTVGGSARVVIRGESSLNYQGNQPLYVIDGVPVGNDAVQNFNTADFGNSSAEFNAEDVENVSVLKGPAASALYGSRAANGVILITTKKGSTKKGLGISYSGTYSVETPLILPKLQRLFGMGNNGVYVGDTFGFAGGNGVNDSCDESWGPRFTGQPMIQFDSPTTNGYRAGDMYIQNRGEAIATPWVANPDNLKDFFSNGHTTVNNVSLSNATDRSSYRVSYTNHSQKGLMPNNTLYRNNFNVSASHKINNFLEASVNANYLRTTSDNRPDLGYGRNTAMYFFIWLPQSHNINSYKDYWIPGMEGVQQFMGNWGEQHNNPYFYQYENTSAQKKDKFYGNLKLDIKISDKWKATVRGGTDFYYDFRPRKMAFSTQSNPYGFYQETRISFQENNFDGLVTYNSKIGDNFNVNLNAGGNIMYRTQGTSMITANSLIVPNFYSFANSREKPDADSWYYQKQINSVYANGSIDFQRKVYVDFSMRNDWSSTLPAANNSYFYPSITTSVLLNEIWQMGSNVNLLKVRGGYAQVGNDTDPYNLRSVYYTSGYFGGKPLISEDGTLKNANLKPERLSTIEVGAEFSGFNNRLRADISYYVTDAKDQILNLAATPTTGYSGRVVNAGKIRNSGVEIMLGGTPIKTGTGFNWDVTLNFAANRGKVLELAEGINELNIAAPGENARIVAKVGDRVGELWGPGYKRVEEGPMKGQRIIGSNGLPEKTTEHIRLGNVNPDWTAGFYNNFSYKGFNLGVLLDVRYGGVFVSRTINKGIGAGQLIETEVGRGARKPLTEYNDPYYLDGAALVNGSYVPNLTDNSGKFASGVYGCNARDFHKGVYDHNSEQQLQDASFMKLRELKIGYTLPKSLTEKAMMQQVTVSLIGRDLFLLTKNQHVDPESSAANTGSGLIMGFEDLSVPASKSIGVQLNVTF